MRGCSRESPPRYVHACRITRHSTYITRNILQLSLDQRPPASATDDEHPSHFQTTVRSIETTRDAIDIQKAKIDSFQSQVAARLAIYDGHLQRVAEPQRKITKLEHMTEYLRVVQEIMDISDELQANMKDDEKLVRLYLLLCDEVDSTNSVIGRLEYVEARHLKAFAEKTAVYWYTVLVEKFSK